MDAKLIFSVLLMLVVGAAGQEGSGQQRGLIRLGEGRYDQLVGSCTENRATLLTCPLLGEDLAISDQVNVTSIRFGIRLCDSSLAVDLTLSNGTMRNVVDFAQCDSTMTLGRLTLTIDIAVFIDEDDNTVINTSMTVNTTDGYVFLFCPTSIPLTQQTECRDGITPPPDSCNTTNMILEPTNTDICMAPETTTMAPETTTTMAPETNTTMSTPTTRPVFSTASGTTFSSCVMLIIVTTAIIFISVYKVGQIF